MNTIIPEGSRRQCVLTISRDLELSPRLRSLLPRLDHREARTHDTALRGLRAHKPALAVVDICSIENGAGLVSQLRHRSEGATCRILILSSARHETHCIDALLSGADDYINQPFGDDAFVDRSNLLLRLGQTLIELARCDDAQPISGGCLRSALDNESGAKSVAVRTLSEIAELLTRKADETLDSDAKEFLGDIKARAQQLAQLLERNL